LAEQIDAGAGALQIELSPTQVAGFVAYLRLIERWNATYNLTAVRDPAKMITHHLLDCLAAAAALLRHRDRRTVRTIVDVGSGAGLPGLVLASVLPESRVTCVDSVGKKAAFITQAAAAAGLANARALHRRVESLEGRYDIVASRAFASLAGFVRATRHLVADNGEWMAMKARDPADEVGVLKGVTTTLELLQVPGLAAERCIVWMRPAA
jgi:16S rRNA (guanine527-N7)-methyltransferase